MVVEQQLLRLWMWLLVVEEQEEVVVWKEE